MRKLIRPYLPDHGSIRNNRWLAPFGDSLLHPALWHLNRHSAAGAVAAGLFCGLIPGPFQMLGAALCAVIFRVNLPLAMAVTLYTNPLTIIPLYLVAYEIGRVLSGSGGSFTPPPEIDWNAPLQTLSQLLDWLLGLGQPLAIGLVVLASLLAVCGYFVVKALWRLHLIRSWQKRKQTRSP